MKIKTEISKIKCKNKSDKKYDEKIISSILNDVNANQMIIYNTHITDWTGPYELKPEFIVGYINKAYIENNSLFVEGEITDKNQTKELIESMYIIPIAFCSIKSNSFTIGNCKLFAFDLTKEAIFDNISTIKVTED